MRNRPEKRTPQKAANKPLGQTSKPKAKEKRKRKPLTLKDVLLAIFCLIMLVAMILFIYEHVKLLFT